MEWLAIFGGLILLFVVPRIKFRRGGGSGSNALTGQTLDAQKDAKGTWHWPGSPH
jgi:hypothetical protein